MDISKQCSAFTFNVTTNDFNSTFHPRWCCRLHHLVESIEILALPSQFYATSFEFSRLTTAFRCSSYQLDHTYVHSKVITSGMNCSLSKGVSQKGHEGPGFE